MTVGENQKNEEAAPGKRKAGKLVIDSGNESVAKWGKVAAIVIAVAIALSAADTILNRPNGAPVVGWRQAQGQSPEVVETATVEPTLEPTATPHVNQPFVVTVEVPVIVTQEVEIEVPVYYETQVEVTRIVEVVATPEPTATIIPLSPGSVEICVRVEAAREIYVGGYGVVSGGCQTFTFGIGQTSIPVHINK